MQFSPRYTQTIIKKHDGIDKGTSSLWACRMSKAYGNLPLNEEHDLNSQNRNFDYLEKQIAIARKFRTGLYRRLIKIEDIYKALRYCPVTIEFDIFSCIYNDVDGIITLPDPEEDTKEDLVHAVTVYGYDKNGYKILNNWANWGDHGRGYISYKYLEKYFISAWACDASVRLPKRNYFERQKIKINNRKYSFTAFKEGTFLGDGRSIFNIEIFDGGGTLAGWTHFMYYDNCNEILDIFILEKYRRNGLGTFLINRMVHYTGCINITGYISGYDLLGNRDAVVKSFLIKNGLTVVPDASQFRDCKNKIIRIDRC